MIKQGDIVGVLATASTTTFRARVNTVIIPLLYGVRLWLSVALSLYVAFWLQLDEPGWAGTTAAIVCLPQVGSSLRKAWFRILGTLVGALMSFVLTACFPQDRVLFLGGLALWAGVATFASTILRNFASYGAALSGYTVAIIAGRTLGSFGGVNADAVFDLAVARTTSICVGIACAGFIRAVTDIGVAPQQLANEAAALYADIMRGFNDTFAQIGSGARDMRPLRRALAKRIVALEPLIDQTVGESSTIRYHSPVMQRTVDGLFVALVGWRAVGNHLAQLHAEQNQQQVSPVLQCLPQELQAIAQRGDPLLWQDNPEYLQRLCETAVVRLVQLWADTPSLRLLADKTAETLTGMIHALDGLALVSHARRPASGRGRKMLRIADLLPAFVNAARASITIATVSLFWIVTGWPSGVGMITIAMVLVVLFSPRADQSYAAAVAFSMGVVASLVLVATVHFAALPAAPMQFSGFALVIGVCLVPIGAMTLWARKPLQIGMSNAMTMLFIPLLAPTNAMSYDTQTFYNSSLATVAGCAAACLAFLLIPPLLPTYRARRLLNLTLADLRRLAKGSAHGDWCGHVFGRLVAMPPQASPLQLAQLMTILSIGSEIQQLRNLANWLGVESDLERALVLVSRGDSLLAVSELAQLDATLAAKEAASGVTQTILRARGSIIVLSEALRAHMTYFDVGAQT